MLRHRPLSVNNVLPQAGHGGGGSKDSSKPDSSQPVHVVAAEMHSGSAVSTYNCPICRKAQILDLDRLQVELLSCPYNTTFVIRF